MHNASPILSTLRAGAEHLAVYDWPLTNDQAPRGTVLLVHGLAEHMGRYAHVAAQLNAWGFHVRGFDQYGHGLSSGVRGRLLSPHGFTDDVARVLDAAHLQSDDAPLVLLGHSMGGVVAAHFVAQHIRPVDGLVLSSPAFKPQLRRLDKALLFVMSHMAPQLCVDNGLDARWVARDQQAVAQYVDDPLVHRQISAALAQWIIQTGQACVDSAPLVQTPTLLLYAGHDRIVCAQGSEAYAAASPTKDLTVHGYAEMYHEIFNDPAVANVFTDLQNWLTHLPARA